MKAAPIFNSSILNDDIVSIETSSQRMSLSVCVLVIISCSARGVDSFVTVHTVA